MDNGDLEKSEFSLEYVGYLNSFTIKANTDSNLQSYNVDIKKGQKFKIKADKCNFLSVSLSDSFPFDNNTLYRLIADKTVDGNYVSDIFTAEKDYKGIKFYSHEDCDIKLNLLSDNESDIWEELNRKENTREIKLNFTNFTFDANGTLGTIERENCLSTQKLNQAGLYIITFPDELKCSYNATYIDDSRFNCDAYCPFSISINENDFTRLKFMKKDDSRLSNNDEILKNVHVYLCENVSNNIKIAASNSHINDKNNADFVCDGQNDTEILCALFCCMNDLGINLMDGIYSINKMWTYKDKSKIAISLNTYSYDGGTGYRRYILMQGRTRTSPQDVGGVKLKVTKELHEKLSNDDSNIMIGAPYQINGDEIQRIATSCVLLNFNIIGYKYDKEITYVDTTRCLSQMIESVNVRSWEKNINSYDAFEDTPNLDCTGIRVGRGSNYGIQNCVKNLNVWYCGKGIACNGEHFTFEDVKAHHDYIGFYFGDRKTVGKMEHTNVMINCSIESCKRLMILSKNGIAEAMDNDGSIPKSTLLIYGLSTENQWQIPTNEIVNERQENMLGIKEIVKNCYRGIILADWDGKIFEDGSGGNFETKVY